MEENQTQNEQENIIPAPLSPDQLNLNLIDNRPSWQIELENYRYRLKVRAQELSVSPYWSDSSTTISLGASFVTTIVGFVIFFYLFFGARDQIPTWPISFIASENRWISADRFILVIVPWFIALLLFLLNIGIFQLYKHDRRLSKFLAILCTYISIITIITIFQIFRLVSP